MFTEATPEQSRRSMDPNDPLVHRRRLSTESITAFLGGAAMTLAAVAYAAGHPITASRPLVVGVLGLLASALAAVGVECLMRNRDAQRRRSIDRHPTARAKVPAPTTATRPGPVPAAAGVTIDADRAEAAMLRSQLADANQSIHRFTSIASQDLRAPLRGIGSLTSFLRDDLGDDVSPSVVHHLDRIELRVERLNEVVDDLIRYARAETRHETATETDLASLVHYLVATVDLRSAISIELDIDLPPILVTATPLASCLRNLIDNAARHHDDPEHGHVVVSAHLEGKQRLVVSVSDDGPGFDRAALQSSVDHVDRPLGSDGHGIGLQVIERICMLHGAALRAEANPSGGSTLTLHWPVFGVTEAPMRRSTAALDVQVPIIDLRDDPTTDPTAASIDQYGADGGRTPSPFH